MNKNRSITMVAALYFKKSNSNPLLNKIEVIIKIGIKIIKSLPK